MQKKDGKYILSASDINGFLNCKRLTELDTLVANGKLKKPEFKDPHIAVMQERGFEHERNYVEFLKSQGLKHTAAEVGENEDAYQKTIALMKEGVDIITQAVLKLEGWYGRSDILRKVPRPSNLGDYSYEVMDTKLSTETKAGSILQLCLYSEMLQVIQGVQPEAMYVVTPGEEGEFCEEKYRVDDYQAYYRLVRSKLLEALGNLTNIYPDPVNHCDICRWWEVCTKKRRDDDHLSLVANLTNSQRKELESINIHTMKDLATLNVEELKKLPNGTNIKALEIAREQARVQVEARETGKLISEFLPFEDGRGLSRLPEPDLGDIFFDIEGDVFVGRHGLEYLLGVTYLEKGKLQYQGFWANQPLEERAAFKNLMEFILERKRKYPNFYIYHYATYETGAVKRLAQRYGIYEEEVDELLRAQKFVDLYGIVKQGIRASVEKYSIKDLEAFTGYQRKIALNDMIVHKRSLEHNLELGRFDDITKEMKEAVQLYNRDDTDSTYYLREWLEKKRSEAIEQGNQILRPEILDGQGSDNLKDRDKKLQDIRDALIAGIDFSHDLNEEERARVLLGDLVAFYRREERVKFSEKYRLKDMNEAQLFEEKAGLANLKLVNRIAPTGRGTVYKDVYEFPSQECELKNDDVFECGSERKLGEIEDFNPLNRTVTIKKTKDTNDIHPSAIYLFSNVSAKELEASSIKICETIIQEGFSGSSYKALKDILLKKAPDTSVPIPTPKDTNPLNHAYKVVESLNNSYFPIQGPPGAGKSYTGSHLIQYLLEKGKKVGVCAIGHKVINGLLTSTKKIVGDKYTIIHRVTELSENPPAFRETKKNEDCENLAHGNQPVVIGGTSWLFARDAMENTLDYLFIDEGGQLSLANLVSISRAAKNIIILGDCQQLEQPIQAAHPDGADLSALAFIQGDHATIPADRGLFLDKTYRLHPEICSFNSELFYENRLTSVEGNENQTIEGPVKLDPLMYLPVEHHGNSNHAMEEIEAIKDLIQKLLNDPHIYNLFNSKTKKVDRYPLSASDIMVVAPYNAQVQRLKDHLPAGVEIGTVDKFQGREAPVVIYSVTTSSPEDAPRGMDFLYSHSRLNVAVSRAQCSFIMVATKKIFEANCKSPEQMKLANAYCRYLEIVSKK